MESIKRIIVLSDIHADLHAFIIAMRDCAQVIRKKTTVAFDQNVYDSDLERLLRINLNNEPNDYVEDLNYEWIAENTEVVIAGDIIDGFRPGYTINPWAKNYPQFEIKLLLFINKLNEMAIAKESRVIKVLGNHEFMNMSNNTNATQNRVNYIFGEAIDEQNNYYKGQPRLHCFNPLLVGTYQNGTTQNVQGEGFKLLMKGGACVFHQIYNNFFVHGSLEKGRDINYYNNINGKLNNPAINQVELFNIINDHIGKSYRKITDPESMVWDRRYGLATDISQRIKDPNPSATEDYCDEIKDDLRLLTGLADVSNFRVFVGHCVQSESTKHNLSNTTFTKIVKDASKPFVEMVEPPAKSGVADPTFNFLFGMTMECEKSRQLNDHYLYHVDVGSSRGFDTDEIIKSKYEEKRHLYSRTPQVIEIYNDNKDVRIIRSTMKNTRIHQPRIEYEAMASTVPELRLSTYQKYLKYKRKYLKLKKLI